MNPIYLGIQAFVLVMAVIYGVKVIIEDKRLIRNAKENEEIWNKREHMRKGGAHLYQNLYKNCN